MKSVIVIHDSYSSNSEPWIVSIADELKVRGFTVYTPKFPTPIGQDYISWKVLFESYAQYIQPDSTLVGVGVGCAFILRYLSEHDITVAKTVFLAPFVSSLANPSEQLLAQSFLLPAFDATLLKPRMGQVEVVISDNDLLVDYNQSKQVADMFGSRITTLTGKGHFRAVNGVRLLPEVVDIVAAPPAPFSTPAPLLADMPIMVPSSTPAAPIAVAAPAAPVALADQVSTTQTTDVAALQRLLADLQARGITTEGIAQSPQPVVSPIAPTLETPVVQQQFGSMVAPVPASMSSMAPTSGAIDTGIPKPAKGPEPLTHSLVSDFSTSLINAEARDVSKTLDDYRKGKEYGVKEKVMKAFRVTVVIIGVLLLLSAGYFAYRVYFFNETLPSIRDLEIAPLNAEEVGEVKVNRTALPTDAVQTILAGITKLNLKNPGDIGVLRLIDADDSKIPADAAMRLIGGTTPSAAYTKVDSFYTFGGIKGEKKTSNFAVFALKSSESEMAKELATWETVMPRDLVAFFAAGRGINPDEYTFVFEDRIVANNAVRVLVARPRTVVEENQVVPITDDATKPVIKSNGIPDTSTPVLPLDTTVGATLKKPETTLPTAESVTISANAVAQAASIVPIQPVTEKNIIDLFKISPVEQTALKRTKNTFSIAANSPLFDKEILPGDLFALESSDKEEIQPTKDSQSPDEAAAPILGGAAAIVQITDILQQGEMTELVFKTLPLSEAVALVGKETLSYTLPNGASLTAPESALAADGPIDVFAYSMVSGKVLVFATNVEDIAPLSTAYFNQRKSIFDMN